MLGSPPAPGEEAAPGGSLKWTLTVADGESRESVEAERGRLRGWRNKAPSCQQRKEATTPEQVSQVCSKLYSPGAPGHPLPWVGPSQARDWPRLPHPRPGLRSADLGARGSRGLRAHQEVIQPGLCKQPRSYGSPLFFCGGN